MTRFIPFGRRVAHAHNVRYGRSMDHRSILRVQGMQEPRLPIPFMPHSLCPPGPGEFPKGWLTVGSPLRIVLSRAPFMASSKDMTGRETPCLKGLLNILF